MRAEEKQRALCLHNEGERIAAAAGESHAAALETPSEGSIQNNTR